MSPHIRLHLFIPSSLTVTSFPCPRRHLSLTPHLLSSAHPPPPFPWPSPPTPLAPSSLLTHPRGPPPPSFRPPPATHHSIASLLLLFFPDIPSPVPVRPPPHHLVVFLLPPPLSPRYIVASPSRHSPFLLLHTLSPSSLHPFIPSSLLLSLSPVSLSRLFVLAPPHSVFFFLHPCMICLNLAYFISSPR